MGQPIITVRTTPASIYSCLQQCLTLAGYWVRGVCDLKSVSPVRGHSWPRLRGSLAALYPARGQAPQMNIGYLIKRELSCIAEWLFTNTKVQVMIWEPPFQKRCSNPLLCFYPPHAISYVANFLNRIFRSACSASKRCGRISSCCSARKCQCVISGWQMAETYCICPCFKKVQLNCTVNRNNLIVVYEANPYARIACVIH